jgi:MFS family permease
MFTKEAGTPLIGQSPKKYNLLKSIKSLKKNPREFWLLYLVALLTITPFTTSVISTTLYTTRILKFTDVQAGMIMGSFGLIVGVFSVLFSGFPARFGLRIALLVSTGLSIVFNLLMTMGFHRYIQIGLMLVLFLPGFSIIIISLKLSVKLYTFPKNRSAGYSLFYMIFFASGGFAGVTADLVLYERTTVFEPYQELMFFNIGCYVFAFFVSCFMRNLDVGESGEKILEFKREESNWEYLKQVFITERFWRFFLLIVLLTVVKSMYFHLTATLPLYVKRDYGEQEHFGILMGAHQVVLLIFIPILTALIRFCDFYTLLIVGSLSTALSPFVLFVEDSFFMLGVFVIVLSIGEAIYAPRLVDYTLAAAPKGKEAIYLGLSNMPNSIGLLVTGISSGLLMSNFCPAGGGEQCYLVWIYIGGYCLFICFIIIVFRGYFDKKYESDDSVELVEKRMN